jgi:chloramphenicol O-acetyltransferase type A
MQYIDVKTWDRREYFQAYVGIDLPYINAGANIDVTNLLVFSEKARLSSYITMVHSAHRVAETVENFRYRIVDGRPVILENMSLSFTHIPEGTDLFVNVTMEYVDDLLIFHERAKAQIAAQGTAPGFDALVGRYDIIGYSAMPWIEYTHVVRTIAKLGVTSNPKITWGKYFKQANRVMMPFSVQVHHGLMDGIHVGRYFEQVQEYIEQLS